MDTKTQNSFSIEYLTRDGLQKSIYGDYQSDGVQNGVIGDTYRRTPSPSDSGMESDTSPPRLSSVGNEDSIIQARTLENVFQNPKVEPVKKEVDDKPTHSYIALISMAILSTPHRRKGNYWTIHPACVDDFANGDFRRRQARRRARKSFKEPTQTRMESSNSLHYVGYVPMTASHLAYHPYSSPSFYYPQSPSLAQNTSEQSSSQRLSTSLYDPACSINATQTASSASVMSAAAQGLFREQSNTTSMTMQAFAAQQQLANSIQFQNLNW
ncbi:hypothetical protein ACF0H5_013381 [Mactra antiquata]